MRLCGIRTVAPKNGASSRKQHNRRIESVVICYTPSFFSSKKRRDTKQKNFVSQLRSYYSQKMNFYPTWYMFLDQSIEVLVINHPLYPPPHYYYRYRSIHSHFNKMKRDEKYPTNFYHIFKTTTLQLSIVKVYLRFKSVWVMRFEARSEGEFGLFQHQLMEPPRNSDGCEKEKKREIEREWDLFWRPAVKLEDDSFFRWKANLWENFPLLCRLKTKYKQATEGGYMK